MNTGWNGISTYALPAKIINLLGNEYWLERDSPLQCAACDYKPTGK